MGIIFAPNFVPKSRANKTAFTLYLPKSLFYFGKIGRSGGIRTHDPFTPSDVPEENGIYFSQLAQLVEG